MSDTSDTSDSAPRAPALAASTSLMLVMAGRVAERAFVAEIADLGLTMRHLGALGHLAHWPDASYSDLARRSRVTTQSMHATVRALEEMSAVRRTLPGAGHRARLEVTDLGRHLLDLAGQAASRVDEMLLADLPVEQRADLNARLLQVALRGSAPGASL